MLRIKDISETRRDAMIQYISEKGIWINLRYIPMAMLSLFKNKDYQIDDYPQTYQLYANKNSLPIYNNLEFNDIDSVVQSVVEAYKKTQ